MRVKMQMVSDTASRSSVPQVLYTIGKRKNARRGRSTCEVVLAPPACTVEVRARSASPTPVLVEYAFPCLGFLRVIPKIRYRNVLDLGRLKKQDPPILASVEPDSYQRDPIRGRFVQPRTHVRSLRTIPLRTIGMSLLPKKVITMQALLVLYLDARTDIQSGCLKYKGISSDLYTFIKIVRLRDGDKEIINNLQQVRLLEPDLSSRLAASE